MICMGRRNGAFGVRRGRLCFIFVGNRVRRLRVVCGGKIVGRDCGYVDERSHRRGPLAIDDILSSCLCALCARRTIETLRFQVVPKGSEASAAVIRILLLKLNLFSLLYSTETKSARGGGL